MAASPVAANETLCSRMYDFSASIMTFRQANMPMKTVVEAFDGLEGQGHKFAMATIKAAYATPRYQVEANQQGAITDFANSIYLACISG